MSRTWKVRFIDKMSHGKVGETSISGDYDYDDVVEFFGLNKPDVNWYEVTEVTDEED